MVYGRGVVATGMDAKRWARLRRRNTQAERTTPLQIALDNFPLRPLFLLSSHCLFSVTGFIKHGAEIAAALTLSQATFMVAVSLAGNCNSRRDLNRVLSMGVTRANVILFVDTAVETLGCTQVIYSR